jgi:hypothetical protein
MEFFTGPPLAACLKHGVAQAPALHDHWAFHCPVAVALDSAGSPQAAATAFDEQCCRPKAY